MTQHNQFVPEGQLGQLAILEESELVRHLLNYKYKLASGPFYLFAIAMRVRKLCRMLSNRCVIFAYRVYKIMLSNYRPFHNHLMAIAGHWPSWFLSKHGEHKAMSWFVFNCILRQYCFSISLSSLPQSSQSVNIKFG